MSRDRHPSVEVGRVHRNGSFYSQEAAGSRSGRARKNSQRPTKRKSLPKEELIKSKRNAVSNHTLPDISQTESIGSDGTTVESEQKASTSRTEQMDAAAFVVSGESWAVLLTQGLTSGDHKMIDSVLSNGDLKAITSTLNDLNVNQVMPLLKAIDERCRNRRRFSASWLRWLHCILSRHMGYLCSISNIRDDLSSLFEWMEKRTANMGELLAVNGKLALINEQNHRRLHPQKCILQPPAMTFEDDGDASSESSGDISPMGDSDEDDDGEEEWWEDEELLTDSDAEAGGKRKKLGDDHADDEEEEEGDELSIGEEEDEMDML